MPHSNAIIAALSASDAAALLPLLKKIDLEDNSLRCRRDHRQRLFPDKRGRVFPTVKRLKAQWLAKDGVVGVAAALDSKIALTQAIVQLSGSAFVCEATAFKGVAMQSERLLSLLVRHEQAVYAQALSNPPPAWPLMMSARGFVDGC